MTEVDRDTFARALFVLGETFNEPISDLRAEGYFDAMKDCTLTAALAAMRQALQTCKFFPRPVELRELILGDPEANADAGWSEVLRELRRVGYIGQPNFTDPRVMATVMDVWGGWRRLCETLPGEGPELVGWIKQFKAAFRTQDGRLQQAALASGMPREIRQILGGIADAKTMPGSPLRMVGRVDDDE